MNEKIRVSQDLSASDDRPKNERAEAEGNEKDPFSEIVKNSKVISKLERRRTEDKPMDILITDVDGTL